MLFDASTMEFEWFQLFFLAIFDDCNSSWGQHLLRMDQRPGPLPPLLPLLLFLQLRIPHLSEVATAIGWHLVFHNPPQVVHLALEPPMLMLLMAMVAEIPVMPTVPVMAGMQATPVRILVVFQLAALVDVGFLLEALEAHKLLQLVAFGDQEILFPSEVLHLEHSRLRRPSTIVKRHISMRSSRDLQIFWGLEAECCFVAKGQHFR